MQTWIEENPRVNINWEVAFEEFNKSKMYGNIKKEKKKRKEKRKIHLSLRWEKSWHGNILTSFGILTISFYSNIKLTWFLQPQKEDLKILNFLVYQNFRIFHIKGQNRPGSWPTAENENWHFIFSFLGSMFFKVLNVINIKVI